MDPLQHSKKPNPIQESKRSQKKSTAPKKDAYARLLREHRSSKFSSYLEQYAKDLSNRSDESSPNVCLPAPSPARNIPQSREEVAHDFSDSSDFSPCSLKNKVEESYLSPRMAKLNSRFASQESEGRRGVPAGDATTSMTREGDVVVSCELTSPTPGDSHKRDGQQRKKKDSSKGFAPSEGHAKSPNKACKSEQEKEKPKKPKKKNPAQHDEDTRSKLKAPQWKDKMQQKKNICKLFSEKCQRKIFIFFPNVI